MKDSDHPVGYIENGGKTIICFRGNLRGPLVRYWRKRDSDGRICVIFTADVGYRFFDMLDGMVIPKHEAQEIIMKENKKYEY